MDTVVRRSAKLAEIHDYLTWLRERGKEWAGEADAIVEELDAAIAKAYQRLTVVRVAAEAYPGGVPEGHPFRGKGKVKRSAYGRWERNQEEELLERAGKHERRERLPPDFDARLRSALLEADARGRHGGLVPLPSLRRALAPLGLSRSTLDAALLERHRARSIDMKIANDVRSLEDPSDGIPVEGRGLLYYIVAR